MIEPLTERERQILELIRQGMSNKAIADALYLSRGTVKAHNHNIYRKLEVSSRTQALKRAQELGLFDEEIALDDRIVASRRNTVSLPASLSPLIGREEELANLKELVNKPDVRLITLLGMGGMGKSRLALAIAQQYSQDSKELVVFVPLAQVAEGKKLVPAILDALGIQIQGTTFAEDFLLNYLHNKKAFLVLDNFEHLLSEVDFVINLLKSAPKVKVLLTSRERLNVSHEVLFVLTGLQVGQDADSDAMRFFVHQAQRINPTFELSEGNRKEIEQICYLTQGMPLALMLAAGWLEHLTLQEITDEIKKGIDILEGDIRDLPARQQSMRSTISSSWNRLSEEFQHIFAALTVFRGGFTREAAQFVAKADIRILQTLVNRSLLVAQGGRYNVHELLRQYGLERLKDMASVEYIFHMHSLYYLEWLSQLEAGLKDNRQNTFAEHIVGDLDNVRQAWNWAVERQHPDLLDGALEALFVFFTIQNRIREGAELFNYTIEHLEADDTVDHALLNRVRIRYYSFSLRYAGNEIDVNELENCVIRAKESDNPYELALAYSMKSSYIGYVERDFEQAIIVNNRVIDLFESLGETFNLATAYHKHGYNYLQTTGLEMLIHYTEKAYEVACKVGNYYNMKSALGNLGSAALYFGRYREAEQYYREAQAMMQGLHDGMGKANAINFTHILFLLGKFDEGEHMLQDAWKGDHDAMENNVVMFGYAMHSFAYVIKQDYEQALQHARTGLQKAHNDLSVLLVIHIMIGIAYCGLHDVIQAEKHLIQAWQRAKQMSFYASATWGLPILVVTSVQRERYDEAVHYAALARTHPLSAKGWLDHWPMLVDAEAKAKSSLDEQHFKRVWQHGVSLEIEDVVDQWLSLDLGS